MDLIKVSQLDPTGGIKEDDMVMIVKDVGGTLTSFRTTVKDIMLLISKNYSNSIIKLPINNKPLGTDFVPVTRDNGGVSVSSKVTIDDILALAKYDLGKEIADSADLGALKMDDLVAVVRHDGEGKPIVHKLTIGELLENTGGVKTVQKLEPDDKGDVTLYKTGPVTFNATGTPTITLDPAVVGMRYEFSLNDVDAPSLLELDLSKIKAGDFDKEFIKNFVATIVITNTVPNKDVSFSVVGHPTNRCYLQGKPFGNTNTTVVKLKSVVYEIRITDNFDVHISSIGEGGDPIFVNGAGVDSNNNINIYPSCFYNGRNPKPNWVGIGNKALVKETVTIDMDDGIPSSFDITDWTFHIDIDTRNMFASPTMTITVPPEKFVFPNGRGMTDLNNVFTYRRGELTTLRFVGNAAGRWVVFDDRLINPGTRYLISAAVVDTETNKSVVKMISPDRNGTVEVELPIFNAMGVADHVIDFDKYNFSHDRLPGGWEATLRLRLRSRDDPTAPATGRVTFAAGGFRTGVYLIRGLDIVNSKSLDLLKDKFYYFRLFHREASGFYATMLDEKALGVGDKGDFTVQRLDTNDVGDFELLYPGERISPPSGQILKATPKYKGITEAIDIKGRADMDTDFIVDIPDVPATTSIGYSVCFKVTLPDAVPIASPITANVTFTVFNEVRTPNDKVFDLNAVALKVGPKAVRNVMLTWMGGFWVVSGLDTGGGSGVGKVTINGVEGDATGAVNLGAEPSVVSEGLNLYTPTFTGTVESLRITSESGVVKSTIKLGNGTKKPSVGWVLNIAQEITNAASNNEMSFEGTGLKIVDDKDDVLNLSTFSSVATGKNKYSELVYLGNNVYQFRTTDKPVTVNKVLADKDGNVNLVTQTVITAANRVYNPSFVGLGDETRLTTADNVVGVNLDFPADKEPPLGWYLDFTQQPVSAKSTVEFSFGKTTLTGGTVGTDGKYKIIALAGKVNKVYFQYRGNNVWELRQEAPVAPTVSVNGIYADNLGKVLTTQNNPPMVVKGGAYEWEPHFKGDAVNQAVTVDGGSSEVTVVLTHGGTLPAVGWTAYMSIKGGWAEGQLVVIKFITQTTDIIDIDGTVKPVEYVRYAVPPNRQMFLRITYFGEQRYKLDMDTMSENRPGGVTSVDGVEPASGQVFLSTPVDTVRFTGLNVVVNPQWGGRVGGVSIPKGITGNEIVTIDFGMISDPEGQTPVRGWKYYIRFPDTRGLIPTLKVDGLQNERFMRPDGSYQDSWGYTYRPKPNEHGLVIATYIGDGDYMLDDGSCHSTYDNMKTIWDGVDTTLPITPTGKGFCDTVILGAVEGLQPIDCTSLVTAPNGYKLYVRSTMKFRIDGMGVLGLGNNNVIFTPAAGQIICVELTKVGDMLVPFQVVGQMS